MDDTAKPSECGAHTFIPDAVAARGIALAPGERVTDLLRNPSCLLETHPADVQHMGLLLDLDGINTGAIWAPWSEGSMPAEVVKLPDCDVSSGDRMHSCGIYDRHPGKHTWELRVHDLL